MKIIITEDQATKIGNNFNNVKIIYSAIFVNKEDLIKKYRPVHENIYYSHSTIDFAPSDISNLEIGKKVDLKIIGRLTTKNVDALLVDNKFSSNKHPHITLSTAPGIKPFASNSEIENNLDKIIPLNDSIVGIVGVFTSKGIIKEDINIPVNTGDTVLMGKFKNKKTVVKDISKDEYNMPTINGKKATTFRIPKNEGIGFDKGGFAHDEEINETPDIAYNGNEEVAAFRDNDALVFGFFNNKAYIGLNFELLNNSNISSDIKIEIIDDAYGKYLKTHATICDFYRYLLIPDSNIPDDRDNFEFPGRLWFNQKIISFWKYPEKTKMKQLLGLLANEMFNIYNYIINFNDYDIEVSEIAPDSNSSSSKLMPLKNFVTSNDATKSQMVAPHLLPASQKRNNPQFKQALDSKYKAIGNKLGKTPEAEYNFYKHYGMGDSIIPDNKKEKLNEFDENDVDLSSFESHPELNNKFWKDENKLSTKVRRRLLKISDDFLDSINVDSKYCKDNLLLGSMANYNWSKYSDIDLHILIDFSKINDDTDLVKDYFDTKRKEWNNEHEKLKIYGFPIEIYVQDLNEKNVSSGIYSLENNKWLLKPEPNSSDQLDVNKIKRKAADIMTKIDELTDRNIKDKSVSELESISSIVKQIFDKVKKMRKSGLDNNGELSIGNIVFKVLRRSGYIEKLVDLKRDTYDKINTIK